MDDIVSTIIDEHRRAEFLYAAFKESKDVDDRLILVYNLIKALSQHAACEELVVYPKFVERVPGGKEIYERSVQQHRQLKVDLSKVDGMTWKDAGWEEAVHKAMQDQIDHAREEEKENLPRLAQHLKPEELRQMAKDFQKAKSIAPTRSAARPHTSPAFAFPLS